MTDKYSDRPYHVAMFVSRNKDNKELDGFKQRNRSFLTQKTIEELMPSFEEFAYRGVTNEMSRFYISVNARKHEVIQKMLLHYLIDKPDMSLTNIEKLIASLSMKKGTASTKKFLFDYDGDSTEVSYFIDDVAKAIGFTGDVSAYETPNGFAVVTEKGFDTRELLDKWKDVELKRDAMLFVKAQMQYRYIF